MWCRFFVIQGNGRVFLVSSLCPIREKRYIRTCKSCDKESIQAFLFLVNYFERCFHISRQVRAVFPPGFPCVSRPILWYAEIRLHGPSSFYSSSHLCRECAASCRSFIFSVRLCFWTTVPDRAEYIFIIHVCASRFSYFSIKKARFSLWFIYASKKSAECCMLPSALFLCPGLQKR